MRCVSACTLAFDSEFSFLGLDFLFELLVFQAVIAFKGKTIDDRRLHHGNDDATTGAGDVHILEHPGTVKRLERSIDLGVADMPAGTGLEIGTDCIRLDAAVALNDNGVGAGACPGRRRCMHRAGGKANAHNPQQQTGYDQPPSQPPTNLHALRALIPQTAGPSGGILSLSLASIRLSY